MSCRLIAGYKPADVPPERTYYATAEIYRTISGSNKEITEKWSSWLYVPSSHGSYPYQDYTEGKINQYISDSLAPGFAWHYRNLQITAGYDMPPTRNMAGADCDNKPSPRIFGGPADNRIIFDTPDETYRYVEIITYDANNALVDHVTVPIKYAEVSFADRPGVPGITNWPVINDDHLLFSDIYLELDDFDITVEVDGERHTVHITDCSVKNIGTVTAELTASTYYRIFDSKFYMYWNESSGELLRFCVNGGSSLGGGGEVTWCPEASQTFSFGLTLGQDALGFPAQFGIHLALPYGPSPAYISHQPKVELADKVFYASQLPVTVPLEVSSICDVENGANYIDKLYWIENYQDPHNETFIAELHPVMPVDKTFTSYGKHKLTAIVYDTDGGYHADSMIVDIRQPGMTVLSPNGGECFEVSTAAGGQEHEITWDGAGITGNVTIKLICEENGQEHQETIVQSTANDGSYSWTVSSYETRNQCRILITDAATGTYTDESDAPFAIVAADSCSVATPITLGHHQGSLRCATNDGGSLCQELCVSPDTQPDVWYIYRATCSGELRVDTCGTNDSSGVDGGLDTVVSLHTRCPQIPVSGTDVCNDDWSSWPDPPYTCPLDQGNGRDSFASIAMAAGDSVLIRVSQYEAVRPKDFFLNLSFYPPLCQYDTNCDRDVDGEDLGYFITLLQFGGDVDIQGLAAGFGRTRCGAVE